MEFLYSPTKDSFYPAEYKEDYKKNNNWPSDLVQVSNADFKTFSLGKPPLGSKRAYINGSLLWVEKQITSEQMLIMETAWCQTEIARADDYINRIQDGEAGIGTVTEWRNYRKKLRTWASSNDVLDKSKRPIAPYIKE